MTLAETLHRRRLGTVIATAALLFYLILQGVFVVRVLNLAHHNEALLNAREAKSKAAIVELQATVEELQAAQTSSAGITECARKLNAAYVLADNEARHLWNTFVTDPNLDREKAKKDLAAADANQFSAAQAVDVFAHHPVLPCPAP